MVYKFPEVDFDWLGKLPGVADDYRAKLERRETLANLDLTNPDATEKAASKLAASGRPADVELAMKLTASALAKRGQTHKISEDAQWRTNWPEIRKLLGEEGDIPTGGATGAPPAAAPAEGYQWPSPGTPQGTIPGMTQAPAQAPPPADLAAGSPSNQILDQAAAAMGGGPEAPGPMGPQLAQMGGGGAPGPVAPPLGPQPGIGAPGGPAVPPWGVGAQMPAVPAPQQRPSGVQIPGDRPTAPLPPGSPQDVAAQEVKRIERAFSLLGKNPPAGLVQQILAKYRSALEKTRLTPDQINYLYEQKQREQQGLPREPIEQWSSKKETRKADTEETQKYFLKYHEGGKTARDATAYIDRMDKILDTPGFVSGKFAESYGTALSGFSTLVRIAKDSFGVDVPEGVAKRLEGIKDPIEKRAALINEFNALSNKLVYATLGTLGNQISEGDRKFVVGAFPSMSLTVDGNKALIKFMRQAATLAGAEAKDALEYRRIARKAGGENVPDMEHYLEQKREKRRLWTTKDGELTPAGQEFKAAVEKHGGAAQPPPPKAPPAPPTIVLGKPDANGNRKRFIQQENGDLVPADLPPGGI